MKLPNNNYFIFNKSQIILRLNMPHNRPNIHYIKRYIIYVFFSYIYWSRKICHVCAYINHFFILHNGINYSKKIPLHFILQRIKRTSWNVVSYILLITIPPSPLSGWISGRPISSEFFFLNFFEKNSSSPHIIFSIS